MKAGFIQMEPIFGEKGANVEIIEGLTEGIDADILVLPELFNTGYLFTSQDEAFRLAEEVPEGPTTQWLCRIAAARSVHIVAGLCEREGSKLYNSAVLVSPEGFQGRYRKIHLFNEEKLWFQPGDEGFKIFDIGLCRIGIMICFDWFFPESVRVLALKGAQVICHPANLVLPYCQQAMTTRCLENRVFAITANRTGREARGGGELLFTGKSQITGLRGEILLKASGGGEEVGLVEFEPDQATDKNLNRYNDLFFDRRTDCYGTLLKGGESSRRSRRRPSPLPSCTGNSGGN